MKYQSVMTMMMFLQVLYKYKADQDREDLLDNYDEMLDLVKNSGYRAVDVMSLETDVLGLACVKKKCSERGLKAGSYILFDTYAACDNIEARVERVRRAMDAAVALGTDVLMLAPQAQEGVEKLTKEIIHANLIANFTPMAAIAKERGIHLVIEDTPDLRLHLCHADDVAAALDAVPGLELVYDSGNMVLVGEDPVKFLRRFAGRVGHVHLKDMRPAPAGAIMFDKAEDGTLMATAPTGSGIIDLPGVIDELRRQGYAGGITAEFFVDDDREYLKSLVRTRRHIESLID